MSFSSDLQSLCANVGISLDDRQVNLFRRHIDLLKQWNAKTNLTRITDRQGILAKHLLDSIIPAQWLPDRGRALDIGSGPGFPAIPLKILYPQLHFTLLESERRKASFLKVLIAELSLEGMEVRNIRWEHWHVSGNRAERKKYCLATMRALRLSPDLLRTLAAEVLDRNGCFAFWAGPEEEIDKAKLMGAEAPDLTLEQAPEYTLPYGAGSRRLLLWKKR